VVKLLSQKCWLQVKARAKTKYKRKGKNKNQVVPLQAKKASRGSGGTAPLTLNQREVTE